MQNKNIIN